ncbi:MAG: DUF2586 family protein [Mycobacterium sp.]
MGIPAQTLTVRNDGLNITPPSETVPVFIGVSSSGTQDSVLTLTSSQDARDTLGQGPLVEDLAAYLDIVGGTAYAIRSNNSTAGSNSAVSASGGGPTVTIAGTPSDSYTAKILIVLGGALGTATFKYYLDGLTASYSRVLTVPSGGTYLIPGTGITVTFASGTYVAAETYSFTTTAGTYTAANATTMLTALQTSNKEFDFIVFSGEHADASTVATLIAAIDTRMTALANAFRYARYIISAGGSSDTATATGLAASLSDRMCAVFGEVDQVSAKPMVGWIKPTRQAAYLPCAIAAGLRTMSGSMGRVASGPIPAMFTAISHDERVEGTLFDERITTLRTYAERPGGFYVTAGQLKSADGSDFDLWELGRVMDEACAVVVAKQIEFINSSQRIQDTGILDERDALRLEAFVQSALDDALGGPVNDEGGRGHVSAVGYAIDRTNNVGTTRTIISTTTITPRTTIQNVNNTIGYTISQAL